MCVCNYLLFLHVCVCVNICVRVHICRLIFVLFCMAHQAAAEGSLAAALAQLHLGFNEALECHLPGWSWAARVGLEWEGKDIWKDST